MKKIIAIFVGLALWIGAGIAAAQDVKPYKDGPVVGLSYIKVKNGRFDDYMSFLDKSYKPLMEAYKKAGLIVGYSVLTATARSPREPDIILSITYPNMAALDRTDDFEAVDQKVVGSTAVQNKGSIDRDAMREVLGSEILREMILK
jgi:hypothetical protein